jgi:hypothetical protein
MQPGRDYAAEGRALQPIIYPVHGHATAARLLSSAHKLIRADGEVQQAIGFFLFGLSEGVRDERRV